MSKLADIGTCRRRKRKTKYSEWIQKQLIVKLTKFVRTQEGIEQTKE